MDVFADLKARGLFFDATGEDEVRELLASGPITLYCGFDPTSDSLHVGNMVPLLTLARFQRAGHRPVALAGGATGLVGDPSGKSKERNLLDRDQLNHNTDCIKKQLGAFLNFDADACSNAAIMVDNADWFGPITFLDFLRDVGKHFSINVMMAKDSVKGRLETGISYTEFSYMLLQAYDFLHLYREHGCVLQIGGSDQWGNIVAGTDLIRRVGAETESARGQAFGLTLPLICDSQGNKLGKSVDGAVYLDPEKTSPYQMFQFFMRTEDRDVVHFLKVLTFVELEEIATLETEVAENPGRRNAQKRLAWEFTRLIHGDGAARSALAASQVLYGGSVEALAERDLVALARDMPFTDTSEAFGDEPRSVIDLLASSGLCKSRGEAKRLAQQGGAYVNNIRRANDELTATKVDLLFGRYLLLRAGKKKYHLLVFRK